MDTFRTIDALRAQLHAWKSAGMSVALVPTMGYLHDGHLSLVQLARELADRVVVSIFVNPSQFGPNEDLAQYPRDETGDLAKLDRGGAHAAFLPDAGELYPTGYETYVSLERLPNHLCGLSRPGHFRGVATVCAKLFWIAAPHVAVFGEKDWQQLQVIRRLVKDLHIPVRIAAAPLVREPDGLAMSSRNAYLSTEDRARALSIVEALRAARTAWAAGERDTRALEAAMTTHISSRGGRVEYTTITDPDTLEPFVDASKSEAMALVAAHFGHTRLIDNMRLVWPQIVG